MNGVYETNCLVHENVVAYCTQNFHTEIRNEHWFHIIFFKSKTILVITITKNSTQNIVRKNNRRLFRNFIILKTPLNRTKILLMSNNTKYTV